MKSEANHMSLKNMFLIVIGVFIMSMGYHFFIVPNDLAPGGVTGLAIVLNSLISAPIGLVTALVNIPLFLIGYRILGRNTAIKSVIAALLLSAALDYLPLPAMTENPILAAVFGGVFVGAGLGLVVKANASTGGSDLLALIFHKKHPSFSVGNFVFVCDMVVILTAGIVFGAEQALYAFISLFITMKVMDMVQEGFTANKAFFIITHHGEEIANQVMRELNRGITFLDARGGYSQKDVEMLFCVVGRMQVERLKGLVKQIDPKAFVVTSSVNEVAGEGFSYPSESPKLTSN